MISCLLILLVLIVLLVPYSKNHYKDQLQGGFFSCFLKSFTVSGFMFRSLIHFVIIFCVVLDRGPLSFFCLWLSTFTNNIYLRNYPFLIEYFWLPHQILFDHIHESLFLFLCSVPLTYVTFWLLFWLLYLGNMVWNIYRFTGSYKKKREKGCKGWCLVPFTQISPKTSCITIVKYLNQNKLHW